jgi:hypothetical protein
MEKCVATSVLRTGLIGVKSAPQLEAFTALENHGHLRNGKATHYVYDIFQAADYMALNSRCLTFDTALSDN